MKYSHSDSDYNYYIFYFQGIEVRIQIDKKTNQIMLNSDDLARSLGYEDMSDLLVNNEKAQDIFFDGLRDGYVIQNND